MRLHRFFIEEHLRNKKEVSIFDTDIIHQWKDVFRLRAGDKVILLDNSGFEYLSEVVELHKAKAELKIIEQTAATTMAKKEIWLFASLIKKDNFEWILEKGTELGVSHFVPVLSARTEKKDLNMERAIKIVREASEQSGRGTLPEVHEPLELKKIFDGENNFPDTIFAFHMTGEAFDVQKFTKPQNSFATSPSQLGILIGPEGGWSDNELELFKEKNIPLYSIGNQVLRAETAAIVIPALLLL
jgi:16S rRNA (uracil1498-N3)-methyltransferase